jgi:NAD(P)-dependent dehydrogenase (short-subunit alcohol dehydrogenase family)
MSGSPRTVVICGATAGVGRATARLFALAGDRVVLIARSETGLAATRAELQQVGATSLALSADVADADAIERAAEQTETEFGPIDVWVNAAMATVLAPALELTSHELERVTDVTYLGSVNGTLAALRRMKPRDHGTIVQVGSALAYRAIPLQAAYCAAKFAIRGFTDALRCELIHDGSRVRLTMVQLPAHNTPQFDWARNKLAKRAQPVPPIHTPEVAARAIVQAAEQAPRELWVGGPSFQAILGNMAAPSLLDRMMARNAYDGQMGDVDHDPGQPDNLDEPVEGLHRTDGPFVDRARNRALSLSAGVVRGIILIGLLVLAALLLWIG